MAEETKVIRIIVDSSRAVDGSSAATRAWERMERAQNQTASSLDRMESMLRRVGGFLAGTVGARAILQAADAFTALTNAIKVSGAEGASLLYVQERLFAAANKNGVEVGALGQLYSRTALAGKELGISQERLLEFVDGVTAALRVQGGTTAQASGALLQLSQALGAGIVRAEEFNSILEGALPIAQAAARGMDGMGGSVAKLRTAVIEGKVTSQQFFEATMRGFEETRKQAEGASLTIGQSLASLSNAFTNYIGQADKASGASAALAKAIAGVGKALDDAGKNTQAGAGGFGDLPATIASTVKEVEAIGGAFERLGNWIASVPIGDWIERNITAPLDDFNVAAARAAAQFIEAFRVIPDALGKLFVDGMNRAIAAVEAGLNTVGAAFADSWLGRQVGASGTATSLGRIGGGGFGSQDYSGRIHAAGQAAASDLRTRQNEELDRREHARALARQAGMENDEARARLGGMAVSGPLGLGGGATGTTAGGKAAENAAKKYAELTAELELTAAAQTRMADAARRGEVEFRKQEAALEAQKKLLDIFGKTLDETDPRLTKIRDLMLSIAQGKVAEAFATATTELEKQNVVLQRQIELMDQAPEIQARELALIKAKQEAEKGGTAITQEMIDARTKAIEQNETLKLQQEDLKKSQELWLSPIKSALESIQQSTADWIDSLLDGLQRGKLSFADFGQAGIAIIRRMVSEILSLAVIRPMLGSVLNGLAGMGIVGQNTVRQLGYGSSGGGGLGMPSAGGGSLLGGGGGGWLGGVGDWLNTPFTGPYAGMSPSSMAGVPMLSPSMWNPSTWSITPLQGLGAAAGIGMGAYQLLAGNGSTASTIGGIGSMIGGAVSLIPGIGQIAGPAIAILSSILPGLFGEQKPTITNQEFGQVSWGANGFTTSGGAWGPSANAGNLQGPLGQVGQTMQGIFDALGGVKAAEKVWGVALQSFSQQYGDGNSFSNQTSFLVGPGGQRRQWGQGSNASDIGMEAAGVAATLNSILGGAVGEISANMRKALEGVNKSGKDTFATLATVVAEVKAYDDTLKNLGKTTTAAEQALKAVDDSFASLYATAEKYGLKTAELDAAKLTERQRVGTDFAASIDKQLLAMSDPLTTALIEIGDERTNLLRNNSALMAIQGYQDQALKIEELYLKKRNEIIEQSNAAAVAAQKQAANDLAAAMTTSVGRIQDLIRELSPGGRLANMDPTSQLAGLRATSGASLSQAFADPTNTALVERAVGDARSLLEFSQSYYAGGAGYVRDQQSYLSQLPALQTAVAGAQSSGTDPELKNLFQQLLVAIRQPAANGNSAQRDADMTRLINLLERYIANGRTAA